MSSYLTQLQAEAHMTDLQNQARRTRLARAPRERGRHPRRLRTSTGRLLVALAIRLDDRLRPTRAPAPAFGACS